MRSCLVVVLLLLAAAALAGIAWALLPWWSSGFSAREEPTAVEAFVARRMRSMAIPAGARERTNPVALSEQILADARHHFADHCAICHGNDGRGEMAIGQGLYPKPPDMADRSGPTQTLSDGEIFFIIQNGVRLSGMPAFGGDAQEHEEDSWELVHFIRHLPDVTGEELAEMEAMNPKSRHEMEQEQRIRDFLEGGSDPPPHDHQHEND